MAKPKRKDPFVNYTTEQVFASEALLYVIQVGADVFEVEGQWFFVKKAATVYYNKILRELMKDIYKGTTKEQKRAKKILGTLKIVPLRMH
jgi:hypothetical protein